MRKYALAMISITVVLLSRDVSAAPTCPFQTDADDQAVFAAGINFDGTLHNLAEWNGFTSGTYLGDGSWNPWSWPVVLDLQHPATKMANALMLIAKGHWDTYVGWHPSSSYLGEAMMLGSRYHNDCTWSYNDDNSSTEADTHADLINTNTGFHCQVFGTKSIANSATERSAVIIHEAWHTWQYAHGYDQSHGSSCPAGSASCDYYYPHTQIEYLPGDTYTVGDLNFGDPTYGRFHTPYQIAAEYECDIAQFARPWVPLGVTGAGSLARAFSNIRTDTNFMNAVSWRCGKPLPFD